MAHLKNVPFLRQWAEYLCRKTQEVMKREGVAYPVSPQMVEAVLHAWRKSKEGLPFDPTKPPPSTLH